jgi:lysozyme
MHGKKTALIILGFAIYAFTSQDDPLARAFGEFYQPWESGWMPLIIDAYAKNVIDWDKLATDPRVVGVIHKATEGYKRDPCYKRRKKAAQKGGYLWGSYHLGVRGKPEKQAKFYLKTVRPGPDELIALDIESLDGKRGMSVDDARRFIQCIKKEIGRYPMVYGNHEVIAALSVKGIDPVFSKTPLWYARFQSRITNFPTGTWGSYALWQFSSEYNSQTQIPGTQRDIDINVFNGTKEELKRVWPFISR